MMEPNPVPPPLPVDHRSLNDLTDHLLLYILSFIPTHEAVRTTPAVCRRWRHLWKFIPSLNFDCSFFYQIPNYIFLRRSFFDFVNRTLILRSHSFLRKFRLLLNHGGEFQFFSYIDPWIQYVVARKTLELEIDFCVNGSHDEYINGVRSYDFRFVLLKNSEVRVLSLCHCSVTIQPSKISDSFSSITSLHLNHVYLSDNMVINLMSGLSNLESLVLENFCGIERKLKISSNKLKKLSLWGYDTQDDQESLEISSCPNLCEITIGYFLMGSYSIENVPVLMKAKVDFCDTEEEEFDEYWEKVVRMFEGIRHLSVQNWWYKFLLRPKEVDSKKFALNRLTWLELYTGYAPSEVCGLAALLDICPVLDVLILDCSFKPDEDEVQEELVEAPKTFNMPRLRQAKMKNFYDTDYENRILYVWKTQAPMLEKIVISHAPMEGESGLPRHTVLTRQLYKEVPQESSQPSESG